MEGHYFPLPPLKKTQSKVILSFLRCMYHFSLVQNVTYSRPEVLSFHH